VLGRRLATLVLTLTAGCATQQSVELAQVEVPEVAVEIAEEGPWRELPPDRETASVADAGSAASPAPCSSRAEPRPGSLTNPNPNRNPSLRSRRRPRPTPPAPVAKIPVPVRREAARMAPRGAPDHRPPEQIARERHLEHPTRIRAAKITFYCPRAYLSQVQLTGVEVKDPRPGRRIATGDARLTCRELTLEAAEIVLRVRKPGEEDVQVSARGSVAFVTDQRGRILRHEGLRILMLKNDVITPLR